MTPRERLNAVRVNRIASALGETYKNGDAYLNMSDAIADMMHLCAARGIKFERVLENAKKHYEEEKNG